MENNKFYSGDLTISPHLTIRVKKLDPNAVISKYAKDGDAGLDLTATSIDYSDFETTGIISYGTGLAIEIPKGYEGELRPRSSIYKTNLLLSNSPGTADSGYRGEFMFKFRLVPSLVQIHEYLFYKNDNAKYHIDINKFKIYKVGDRIGQLLIKPYPFVTLVEADELSKTERGITGFGSTNK